MNILRSETIFLRSLIQHTHHHVCIVYQPVGNPRAQYLDAKPAKKRVRVSQQEFTKYISQFSPVTEHYTAHLEERTP
jgi:hypothetical protein